jgi:hypothetical protein
MEFFFITCIIQQQIWAYIVEEKLNMGTRKQKRLNTSGIDCRTVSSECYIATARCPEETGYTAIVDIRVGRSPCYESYFFYQCFPTGVPQLLNSNLLLQV